MPPCAHARVRVLRGTGAGQCFMKCSLLTDNEYMYRAAANTCPAGTGQPPKAPPPRCAALLRLQSSGEGICDISRNRACTWGTLCRRGRCTLVEATYFFRRPNRWMVVRSASPPRSLQGHVDPSPLFYRLNCPDIEGSQDN